MQERIAEELALVREWYRKIDYIQEGRWIRVAGYPLPQGWNRDVTDVAFQVSEGHPAAHPYGFHVPSGILFNGATPKDYTNPSSNQPPFGGTWGFFSWAPLSGWAPSADVRKGANLLDWVKGFKDRFEEGR